MWDRTTPLSRIRTDGTLGGRYVSAGAKETMRWMGNRVRARTRRGRAGTIALLMVAGVAVYGSTVKAETRSLLVDRTGDARITVMGFGDSITFGVGDDEERPVEARGYLPRLAEYLGVSVVNQGIPGEELVGAGEGRFARTLRQSGADVVIVAEGSNDAVLQTSASSFRRAAQRIVNVARALGRQVVVGTVPIPVAERESLSPFTALYSSILRTIAEVNQVPLVDTERMWRSSCGEMAVCRLLNIPEGLHPNERGYTAMAQLIGAVLHGVDPFRRDSSEQLASLFGVAQRDILIVPDEE